MTTNMQTRSELLYMYHNYSRHCLGFVYGELIEASLNDFKARWNSHRIRHNRRSGCPSGVPDDLYTLPHLTGMHALYYQ